MSCDQGHGDVLNKVCVNEDDKFCFIFSDEMSHTVCQTDYRLIISPSLGNSNQSDQQNQTVGNVTGGEREQDEVML